MWLVGAIVVAALSLHGDLHEQILETTRNIEKSPKDARLYFTRAEQYRHHGEGKKALKDLDRAEALDPKLAEVDLVRGRLWLAAGDSKKAVKVLDHFLKRSPKHPQGLICRARARATLKDHDGAVHDFSAALAVHPHSRPGYYIERANAQAARKGKYVAIAIRGLDEGIKKLGPAVTLHLRAVDLEVKIKRYDAVLRRIDALAARSARKDSWFIRRGEILKKAGRKKAAHKAFTAALKAIESLPSSRRRVPATTAQIQKIEKELEGLNASP